jgi:hypothetical protein
MKHGNEPCSVSATLEGSVLCVRIELTPAQIDRLNKIATARGEDAQRTIQHHAQSWYEDPSQDETSLTELLQQFAAEIDNTTDTDIAEMAIRDALNKYGEYYAEDEFANCSLFAADILRGFGTDPDSGKPCAKAVRDYLRQAASAAWSANRLEAHRCVELAAGAGGWSSIEEWSTDDA